MRDPGGRTGVGIALALCIAAVAIAPLHARGLDPSAQTIVARAPSAAGGAVPAVVAIVRDPFGSDATPHPMASIAASPLAPLPPNLADDPPIPAVPGTPGSIAPTIRVTAVVTGPHPYALLDIGGNHQIHGIGDRVAQSAIDAIDITGVVLHDGTRLPIDPETTSP